MSQEAKRVKILTLAELLGGFALICYAIVSAVMGAATAVCALVGIDGLVTLVFGVRGALIANVPARIGKLAGFALVILVVQLALVCAVVFAMGPDQVQQEPIPVIVEAIPAVVTLAILVLSRGMAKRAER